MVLLRGRISGLNRSRRSHDFVLSEVQHQQVGVTAIAASIMGMGATGIGLIGMAGNSDEEADWVEFELDDKQVKGWLWMMPMRNGDTVEVVAEPTGNNRYVAYAVKRDGDDLLAVYPHATAGRKVHYRKSVKAWMWCSFLAYLILPLFAVMQRGLSFLFQTDMPLFLLHTFFLWIAISAVIAFRASRKLMEFVRIAETIFKMFGCPDPVHIDLRQTSKDNRRENKLDSFWASLFSLQIALLFKIGFSDMAKEPSENQELIKAKVLLRGVISGFERSRRSHGFVVSKVQHQVIGATAIVAAAMGMGATGMGLIGAAGNSDEDADWVEFELDGKQIQGWLWMMPMRNGDTVEVVAEPMGNNRYMAYAVKRARDDLLAVYPHAIAGRKVHYRESVVAWKWLIILMNLSMILFLAIEGGFSIFLKADIQLLLLVELPFSAALFGAMALSYTWRLMAPVRIAETIFATFGWPDIENIDLRKTSRENRRDNTLSNFGHIYFRYK